ncbi:fatty acid desaturase [Alteromonas sp. a30]|uniref:fatty acid desaturase n=1 Tax=Alteromonas sp. a30 TaxID=2730917 RepID=UPI00227F65C8|nr:fatty acid desaturase [Alteromonas sp. a30]MCY7294075.1 fatty acid desaturase [Alteromonas sp. a30]
MNDAHLPKNADAKYIQYIEHIEALKKEPLGKAIPKALFKKNVLKSLAGFVISYSLYIGSIIAIAYSPHWSVSLLLLLPAGLGGWGLHCIAHDCGHGSFSNSRIVNTLVGHLALIPLLYPFHAWRHVHNMHHSATNNLEMDTDWRPISKSVYDRMPFIDRVVYLFTRSFGFWAGTVHYWWVSAFRPSFFPQKKQRNEVRRSMLFVIIAGGAIITLLAMYTGLHGVLWYFVLPLLATHAWFSVTTLMHHTEEDVPFLERKNWSLNGSRILLTTDYIYPKWLLLLTHNISIHAAHHVSPTVPFYNLPKAQAALEAAYPGMIRQAPFTFKTLWRIITRCHFYDPQTGYYQSFSQAKNTSAEKTAHNAD